MTKSDTYFLGIGAQKSGTTWLYKRLSELPSIEVPPIKELHYFDRDPSYPSPNILSTERTNKINALKHILGRIFHLEFKKAKWYTKWYFGTVNNSWYLSILGRKKIKGEITPSYSILKNKDIVEINNLLGNVKIILLLRNPIERAWSHYKHYLKVNKLNKENLKPLTFMKMDEQIIRSEYFKTIKNYQRVLGKNQILIGFYDSIKNEPLNLMQEICLFLNAPISEIANNCQLNEITYRSEYEPIPKEIYEYLKNYYRSDIKVLSQTYGGYFSLWEYDIYGTGKKDNLLKSSFIL